MRSTLTREPRPLRLHLNTFANPQTTRPETDGKKPMDGKRPDELKRSQLLRNQREVNGSKAVIGIYKKKKEKKKCDPCLPQVFLPQSFDPLHPKQSCSISSECGILGFSLPSFSPHLKVRGGGRGGGGCPHHCQQQHQSAAVSLPFALAASAQRQ